MAEKMSGIEMVLNSLMKSAGIDPVEIQKNIASFAEGLKTGLENTHKLLLEIREEQRVTSARLERIEIALDIRSSTDDTAVPQIAARRD